VWQYIRADDVPLPSLYFAHRRELVSRDGVLLAVTPHVRVRPEDTISTRTIRFRTIGDATCTGAVESEAATVDDILLEISTAQLAERGGRGDDRRSESAMEDRKRRGYF
jgi:sulfate adenylyltransferase subunit 2